MWLGGSVAVHLVKLAEPVAPPASMALTLPSAAVPLLRVGFDVTPLIGQRTGIGHLVAGLADALAEHDSSLLLVPFAVTFRGRREVRAQRRPMPARPLRFAWVRSDHPTLERWTGRLDVVHGTNYVCPPLRRGASIVSVHDLTFVHHPDWCTADTREYPRLIRRAIDRGAWIHTDSHFVADEVAEWAGIDPSRVITASPGVPAVCGEGLASPIEGRYVLSVGTIEPRKNYPTLVRAFEHVAAAAPDVRLVIAGAPGWGEQELSEAMATITPSTRARVVRLGYVDRATRDVLLRGASVFAYPSLYEGFGFPPLEAMSVGVPVVASSAGSLPEVLGEAAVLVSPRDTDALAAALVAALESPTDGEKGRCHAAAYRWDRCAHEMVRLYQTAANVTVRSS